MTTSIPDKRWRDIVAAECRSCSGTSRVKRTAEFSTILGRPAITVWNKDVEITHDSQPLKNRYCGNFATAAPVDLHGEKVSRVR